MGDHKPTNLRKRLVAAGLSALLVCGLMPGLAFASLKTGSPADMSTSVTPAKTSQSKTTVVYVLTNTKSVSKGSNFNQTSETAYTYSNKSGLLLTQTTSTDRGDVSYTTPDTVVTNTYDRKRCLVKQTTGTEDYTSLTRRYTYNKKGYMIKDSQKGAHDNYQNYSSVYRYNKLGRVAYVTRNEYSGKVTYKFTYNKKRQVTTVTNTKSSMPLRYYYDKKGNLAKYVAYKGDVSVPITYKNTYSSKTGKLTKRVNTVHSDYGTTTTTAYKWKKVTVPTALAARVNAQQWALLNQNLNFANGGWGW